MVSEIKETKLDLEQVANLSMDVALTTKIQAVQEVETQQKKSIRSFEEQLDDEAEGDTEQQMEGEAERDTKQQGNCGVCMYYNIVW